MPIMELIFVAIAMVLAAVFKNQMRVSVEAASRNPFKALMWGLVGGGVAAVLLLVILGLMPKERVNIFAVLLLPFLGYLYALGSVGLVRLVWSDAFNIRFIIIPVMMGFSYLAKVSGVPFGNKIDMGLFAFGFGCLAVGLGYYDREQELAGHREREEAAPESVAVSGSTKKMADITPIFRAGSGRNTGAPPEEG